MTTVILKVFKPLCNTVVLLGLILMPFNQILSQVEVTLFDTGGGITPVHHSDHSINPVNGFLYLAGEYIILQSWLDQEGEIKSLSFYLLNNHGNGATLDLLRSAAFKVYMKHTTFDDYDGLNPEGHKGTNAIGATKMAKYTKVFDGEFSFSNTEDEWKTLTLDTPFAYNNTDNLEILIIDNDDDDDDGDYWCYCSYADWGLIESAEDDHNLHSRDYFNNGTPWSESREFNSRSIYTPAMMFSIDPAPLPIELKHFTARAQNEVVRLDWASYTESNNERYVVERSIDGKNFEVIGEVQGAGNSVETLRYHLYDRSPALGINYYRLKQIDFDGKFEYFDIRSVEFNNIEGHLQLLGNPVTNELEYYINKKNHGEVTVQLTNISGTIISQNKVTTTKQQTYQTIDISSLTQGMYFLQLIVQGKVVDVEKVVVN